MHEAAVTQWIAKHPAIKRFNLLVQPHGAESYGGRACLVFTPAAAAEVGRLDKDCRRETFRLSLHGTSAEVEPIAASICGNPIHSHTGAIGGVDVLALYVWRRPEDDKGRPVADSKREIAFEVDVKFKHVEKVSPPAPKPKQVEPKKVVVKAAAKPITENPGDGRKET